MRYIYLKLVLQILNRLSRMSGGRKIFALTVGSASADVGIHLKADFLLLLTELPLSLVKRVLLSLVQFGEQSLSFIGRIRYRLFHIFQLIFIKL